MTDETPKVSTTAQSVEVVGYPVGKVTAPVINLEKLLTEIPNFTRQGWQVFIYTDTTLDAKIVNNLEDVLMVPSISYIPDSSCVLVVAVADYKAAKTKILAEQCKSLFLFPLSGDSEYIGV